MTNASDDDKLDLTDPGDLTSLIQKAARLKQVRALAQSGNVPGALRLYREITGADQEASQSAVEAMAAGRPIVLDDVLQDVDKFIETIKRNIYALLLPQLTRQYDLGKPVAFGPVIIQKQDGIRMDGRTYAWADILDIRVERGRFRITTREGKKNEARVSKIPNIEMLCQMIGLELLAPQLAYY